jgi:phosphatidylglycerophosphate synthase
MSYEPRKIPPQYECPIDNFLYNNCDKPSKLLRKVNITPNQITTFGLIIGLLSFYCLLKKWYLTAFVFYWIAFYFDCLDGYHARKYNMMTNFGDMYDHARDALIAVLIVGAIWVELSNKERIVFVCIVSISCILMLVHMGCQEQISGINEFNHSLKYYKKLCPNKDIIHVTKYFGCGFSILVISLFILYLKFR